MLKRLNLVCLLGAMGLLLGAVYLEATKPPRARAVNTVNIERQTVLTLVTTIYTEYFSRVAPGILEQDLNIAARIQGAALTVTDNFFRWIQEIQADGWTGPVSALGFKIIEAHGEISIEPTFLDS